MENNVEFTFNAIKDVKEIMEYLESGEQNAASVANVPKEDIEMIRQLKEAYRDAYKLLEINNIQSLARNGGTINLSRILAEGLKNVGLGTYEEKMRGPIEVSNEYQQAYSNDDMGNTRSLEDELNKKLDVDPKQFAYEEGSRELGDDGNSIQEYDEEIRKLENAEEAGKKNNLDDRTMQMIKEQLNQAAQQRNKILSGYFYLTPERMLENLQQMNGGALWNKITANDPDKKYAIERAYLTCSDPALLTNPDFLTDRVNKFLPDDEKADNLKPVHMMNLATIYVGYHTEEVSANSSQSEVSDPSEQNVDYSQIQYPTYADELPDSIKAMIIRLILQKEQEIIGTQILKDPSNARDLIMDSTEIFDRALEELEKQYGKDQVGKGSKESAIAAYITMIREKREHDKAAEISNEVDKGQGQEQENEEELPTQISSEELKSESQRKQYIASLKEYKEKNPDANFGTLQINAIVRSREDVDELKEIVDDFQNVPSLTVSLLYAIDVDDGALENEIDGDVNSFSVQTQRDKDTEMSLAIDHAITNLISNAAMAAIRTVVLNELGLAMTGPVINAIEEYLERNHINQISREADLPLEDIREYLERLMHEHENDGPGQSFGDPYNSNGGY